MAADTSAVARLGALASAIEAVAAAAATARPEALAACESRLQTALANLPDAADLSRATRSDVMLEIDRIQRALRRSRRVGQAVAELVTASLAAQGVASGYARAGAASHTPRLSRLEVRA